MNARYTAGPWEVLGEDEGLDRVPYIEVTVGECGTKTFKPIAHIQPTFDGCDDWLITDEDQANAHLIAAAPDLLEALIDARNNGLIYWEPITSRGSAAKNDMLDRIDAALSKATGAANG